MELYPIAKSIASFDFNTAVEKIVEGKQVTKLEWNDNDQYCFMRAELLHIHRDGGDHKWMISVGDISGKDWRIRDNN